MIHDSGIDAVAFTFPENHPDRVFLSQLATNVIDVLKSEGNDLKESSPQGFEGHACGGAFIGVRHGYYLVKIEGGHAHGIAEAVHTNRIAVKWTRADFAVSYHQPQPARAYTARIRRQARCALRELGNPLPSHQALFENSDGGDTYYLSTGDKSIVHRTYNKSVQSPGLYPEHTWRTEHQVRTDRAVAAMAVARESPSLREFALSINATFLRRYGIEEDWMSEATPVHCPRKKVTTDTSRRLEWFISSGLPCLTKLGEAGVDLRAVLRPLIDANHLRLS